MINSFQLDMIMPEEAYNAIRERAFDQIKTVQYSVVTLPLSGLLEPDFLNTYIKHGTLAEFGGATLGNACLNRNDRKWC